MKVQDAQRIHPDMVAQKVGLKFSRTQLGTHGRENVYHTPLRQDTKPSLHINLESQKFYDNGIQFGSSGAINFVCYLNGIDHTDNSACRYALKILDSLFGSSGSDIPIVTERPRTVTGATSLKKNNSTHIEVVSLKPLFSYSLKDYLSKTRKLDLNIVGNYVQEATCKTQAGKQFFGIASPAGEAFVIRNKGNNSKGLKLVAGQNLSITVYEKSSSTVLLFEGDIDFYTYLTCKNLMSTPETSIVLNSVAMIKRVGEFVTKNSQIKTVKFFRDNDEAGRKALNDLIDCTNGIEIEDQAKHYLNFKDLNEWWCNK